MSNGHLRFMGTSWVDNLYKKIEAMYHEVDGIMCKDTVSHVENHVDAVCEDARKVYSSYMHNLPLPASTNISSTYEINSASRSQKSTLEPNVKPKVGNKGEVAKDMEAFFPGYTPVMSSLKSSEEVKNPSADELRSTLVDLLLNQMNDYFTKENSETNLDDGSKEAKLSSSELSELTCSIEEDLRESFSISRDVKDDTGLVSSDGEDAGEPWAPRSSTHENQNIESNSKEEILFPSKGSELTCSGEEDSSESPSPSSSISKHHEDADDDLTRIPFSRPINGPCSDLLPKTESLGNLIPECVSEISGAFSCSELDFTSVSSQSDSTDQGVVPSSSSSLMMSVSLPEMSDSSMPQKEGETCQDYVDSNRHVISRCTIPTSFEKLSQVLQSESYSNDRSPFFSSDTVLAGQPSTSSIAFEDSPMETIDLSGRVKVDGSCVVAQNYMTRSGSSRRGRFNSYKKMIQNAFVSKKKLEKEYKQLAIWYGDIDADFSQLTVSHRPLTPIVQDDSKNLAREVEWELI